MRDRPCRFTPLVLDRRLAQSSPGSPAAARIDTPSLEQVGPETVKGSLTGRSRPPGIGGPAGYCRTTSSAAPGTSSRHRQGLHPDFDGALPPPDHPGVDFHRPRECPVFHLPVDRRPAQARDLLNFPSAHQSVTHMSQPLSSPFRPPQARLMYLSVGPVRFRCVGTGFQCSVAGRRQSHRC